MTKSPSGAPEVRDLVRQQPSAQEIAMNDFISPDDQRYDDRARALVRIGRDAIAVENNDTLDAYFADGFAFHGPARQV